MSTWGLSDLIINRSLLAYNLFILYVLVAARVLGLVARVLGLVARVLGLRPPTSSCQCK